MPLVGGHVSAAGGISNVIERAAHIKAECLQTFLGAPQQWNQAEVSEEEVEKYKKAAEETGITQNFIHGTYLINLGTKEPDHLQKSIDWLSKAMNQVNKLGMKGVIFHTGSHKGDGFESCRDQVAESLKKVLSQVEGEAYLVLENMASPKSIGGDIADLGWLLKEVNDPRLKVCLDTQHTFAAGYDIKNLFAAKDFFAEFEETIGFNNLVAIHTNDSKTEYKSGRDRHENIGEGFIGKEAFENMLNMPQLKDIPFILEVPGFAGNGPDIENIEILKSMKK